MKNGKTFKSRILLTIELGAKVLASSAGPRAFKTSIIIVGKTLMSLANIRIPKLAAFKHINYAKIIQREWRGILKLNNIRKRILKRIFEDELKDLINKNMNKGGINSLLAKLQSMTPKLLDKLIKEYFSIKRMNYVKTMWKYIVLRCIIIEKRANYYLMSEI